MSIWLEPKLVHFESHLPHLNPIVTDRIARLGLTTKQQAIAFLDHTQYNSSSASELPGLMKVADRVETAIRTSELICVWGDFDADGQTSTTILVSTLRDLGARVTFHIPVRGPESHGIGISHLAEVIKQGAKLILTCDTGITAHKAIEYANSQAVDVVITDHHDLPIELPLAIAITNPKFLTPEHPLSTLAGVGVAYKLAEELYARYGLEKEVEKHLDLTALGLVADMAILKADARYLVQRGLESLRNTQRLGLQILMETAELIPEHLTEEHIGFVIAPRLNALGRLADANIAVELFTTTDSSRAKVIVSILEGLNAQRQLLTNQVYSAAESLLNSDPSILQEPLIILTHPTWHAGIIGIAASRLVERYNRPVILISNPPNEPARGSARSIEGINLTAAIANHKEILLGFGGHPMAAGLSLEPEKIPEFQRKMAKTIASLVPKSAEDTFIQLDGIYNLDDLNLDLADTIEDLAPFGPGNPKLVLASKNLRIINSSRIGRHKEHLKFLIEDNTGTQRSVLWWNAEHGELPEGIFDLAYNLLASDWKGLRQIQMEFIDYRISTQEQSPKKKSEIKIVDLRNNSDPQSTIINLPEGTLIWIEGEEKKSLQLEFSKLNPDLKFANRIELVPAKSFAIWTPPASLKDLKLALDIVNPDQVILLKGSMVTMTLESVVGQLMGLINYTLNHRKGTISYSALAAATAQSESTIRNAISWMIFQGEVSIIHETDFEITFVKGTSGKDPIQATKYLAEVGRMISETIAYRTHFIRADKNYLLP